MLCLCRPPIVSKMRSKSVISNTGRMDNNPVELSEKDAKYCLMFYGTQMVWWCKECHYKVRTSN